VNLLPHAYTNRLTRDGPVVTKRYQGPGAADRRAREAAALTGLAGRLPVPALLPPAPGHTTGLGPLRMTFLDGVPGQELVDAGLASQVLRACGQVLRRVHATHPALAGLTPARALGTVLVHGDFGPNNVLLDSSGRAVTAILDWERVHAGDPVEDLAWCEWIIRMHHPDHADVLSSLFRAYGAWPAWPRRQAAMIAQCEQLLAESQGAGRAPAAELWAERLAVTRTWTA
jgi:hypothetical protein